VRRWQDAASLAWSDGDILEVSRYLNESIYRFERPANPASSLSLGGKASVLANRKGFVRASSTHALLGVARHAP
jgi:hypothetical protein